MYVCIMEKKVLDKLINNEESLMGELWNELAWELEDELFRKLEFELRRRLRNLFYTELYNEFKNWNNI